jgi:hypothetical protein
LSGDVARIFRGLGSGWNGVTVLPGNGVEIERPHQARKP